MERQDLPLLQIALLPARIAKHLQPSIPTNLSHVLCTTLVSHVPYTADCKEENWCPYTAVCPKSLPCQISPKIPVQQWFHKWSQQVSPHTLAPPRKVPEASLSSLHRYLHPVQISWRLGQNHNCPFFFSLNYYYFFKKKRKSWITVTSATPGINHSLE